MNLKIQLLQLCAPNTSTRFRLKWIIPFLALIVAVSASAQTSNFLTACKFISATKAIATGVSGTELLSNDGGSSWSSQTSGLADNLNGVSFYDSNNGILLAAGAISGSNIYKTSNGGLSWVYQASSAVTLQAVSVKAANFAIAVGNTGTILKSTDGGTTWVSQTSGTTNNLYDVHFVDVNNGTAVGELGRILHTTNGGSSWSSQTSGTSYFLRGVHFADANNGAVVGDQGTILHTNNGGSSWTSQVAAAAAGRILYSVYFTDANNGNIGGQGVILHTANGGGSWSGQSVAATIAEISFSGASVGIMVGSSGTILRTTDGGASWTQVAPSTNPPSTPTLSAPANGATGQATTLALSWNTSSGASTYRLQVSTSSTFSTLFLDDSTLTTTSRTVSSLANLTQYYWRVNAKNAYGTSSWSSSWSFTTVSSVSPPGTFNLLSPSNGAIGQPQSGTLSWQSSTNATGYDVYLDGNNPPTTIVSTNQAGTSYAYSGLSNGLLQYWKVVAKNSGGSVTATGAPWSFSTLLSPPPTPALVSPANGATGQLTTLTLSWGASTGAVSYHLQVSTSSTFSSLLVDDATLLTPSRQVSGLGNNATYYWRASASNAGGESAFSAPWSFTTIVASPGAFNLLSPSNAAANQSTNGTLSWQASSNATGYDVYLDGGNPPTTLVSPNQAGVSYSYSGLLNGSTYYWKVVAKNAAGSVTATGAPWSFTTVIAPPPTPLLSSPSSGSSGQPTTLTLSWNSATAATSYRLQVGTDSTFATGKVVDDSTLTVTSRQVGPLANNTKYYWRVNSKNTGGTSAYSGVWNFSTIPNPPTVTTTAATSVTSNSGTANGTVNPNGAATTSWFEWGTSITLATYTSTVSQSVGSGTSAVAVSSSFTGLNPNTTYYYRVAAQNSAGTQRDGILSFTTAAVLPTVTTTSVSSVTSNAATLNGTANPNGAATTVWFEWGTSSTLSTSTSTSSQSIGSGTSAVAVTASLSTLSPNTTYYYRLVGQNSAGTQRDGILSFTTAAILPTATTTAPSSVTSTSGTANGTVNPNGSTTTAWFEWGTSSTLASYSVTVSQSAGSGFSPVAVSASLTGLNPNTIYYFRVVAQNSVGTQRDGILSFTTGAILPTVTTTAATSITTSAATLNATENPNGSSTTAWFEWGTSSTLSSFSSTASQSIGAGSSALAVSANLSGLNAGTTYYYRAVGQNGAGTQKDGILSFSTTSVSQAVPTVTTTAASSVTSNSGTVNGTVNPNGAATTAWFEWGTSSTLATYTSTASQSAGSGTSAVAISASLTGLNANTTYYYRIAAQNSGGTQRDVILSFTTGAVLPTATTTSATSVTSNSGTTNGTVNPNGAATTAWFEWGTSSTLATYTSTASQSAGSGTSAVAVSASLTGLSAGTTYYYRIAAQNSAGTQRDGILSFTTGAVLPTVTTTAATSVTSSSGILNGTVNPNGVATTAWFEWGTSSTLASYTATVSQSAGSGSSGVAMSSNLTGLTPNTTYYFRIAAQNSAGTQRDGILSFTTAAILPAVTTTAATSVTTGGATLNGTENPNGSATTAWFEWGTSSTLSTYSSTATQSIGSSTSVVAVSASLSGLSSGTTYYFRAAGQNAAGTQRDGILSFTTGALPAPAIPILASPANGAFKTGTTLPLSWNASSGATTYRVQLSTSSSFTTMVVDDSTLTATSKSVGPLAYSTTYYWRVNAKNSGGTSGWSTVWGFTTLTPPPPPTVNLPTNGATGLATTVDMTWDSASSAESYRIQLSTDSTFGTMVLDDSAVSTTSKQATSLANGTKYYWHVRSQNAAGASAYSIACVFTTVAGSPPAAPVLLSPANAATNQLTTLTLSWNASSGATSYRLQVSTSSTFTTLFLDDATLTSPSRLVGGLAGGKTYYWRVSASNDGGASAWSTAWSLKTKRNGGKTHLTTASIDFGVVDAGTSKKDSFVLYNIGDTSVTILDAITTDSTFKVIGQIGAVAPTDSQQFYVMATPMSPTSRDAYVILTYGDGLPPDTVVVHVDSVTGVTGVDGDKANHPATFALNQNYPNPFNPTTTISFSLPTASSVTLRVFNLIGQEVATLIENQLLGAGDRSVEFDGSKLSSGAYFYRIEATSTSDESRTFTQLHKMILTK